MLSEGMELQGRRRGERWCGLALGLAALVVAAMGQVSAARADGPSLPPIRHVWVIVEENASWGYDALEGTTGSGSSIEHSFSAGTVPYLAGVLTKQGRLLTRYYGIGHNSQANYVAMSSGQSPTPGSQSDGIACASGSSGGGVGNEIPNDAPVDPHGQIVGQGCMYPAKVKTLADQLEAKGLTWKGYMQDLDVSTGIDGGRCPRGPNDSGHADIYARKHDPWMWFHSITDDQARCQGNDVALANLAGDLQSVATTPNFSFVIPGLFADGHDGDRTANEDTWLRQYVPMIMASPAYRQDGMILIVFDEAATFLGASEPGEHTDACCNEIPGPNSSMPGESGPGGGRTGALVLSPFVKPGTMDDPDDNPTHAGPG
ncbi:MAG: phosphatidylinositol-3-phosphatase, partial [Solirubrobacteraceae bacterium]|nr:phosphatidylinositol-3-phosphatase [Solirubrobacteraceae bacterium]